MKKKKFSDDFKEPTAVSYNEHIDIDRMGSYTGIAETPWETPVQDADDL